MTKYNKNLMNWYQCIHDYALFNNNISIKNKYASFSLNKIEKKNLLQSFEFAKTSKWYNIYYFFHFKQEIENAVILSFPFTVGGFFLFNHHQNPNGHLL